MNIIMKFFLKNFRRGFATNSSSSHSFVYLKEPVANAQEYMKPTKEMPNEFGWEDFKLTTIAEKMFYVLVSKIGNAGWKEPTEETIHQHYEELKDDFPDFDEDDFRYAAEGYIDHESLGIITLQEAQDPHVVIYGGNDNGEPSRKRYEDVKKGFVDFSQTSMDWDDKDAIDEGNNETDKEFAKDYDSKW